MATGKTGGSFWGSKPPVVPPGNALMAKEQAATARQAAGENPSVTPGDILHGFERLLNPPPAYLTDAKGVRRPVAGSPILTPFTLGVQAVAQAPALVKSAHQQAAKVAHPSRQSPPSLGQNAKALLGGAFGFPLMAEGDVHPLLRPAKPTIQKGAPPTAKTLGEAVTGALTGARGTRAQQEALRSEENAKRITAYGKAAQADPTEAGHLAAKSELAGKYPALNFGGFTEFNQGAADAMHKVITDHPTLTGWQKVNAKDAITKIRGGAVPTKSEEKLLRQVFGPDTTKQMMASVSKFHQIKSLAYDIANIPRSIMASYDASGIMRQGLLVGTGHPVIFARNIPAYLKAIKSEDFYNAGMEGLHSRPNAVNGVYEKMGVDLTELSPRGSAAMREESFRSPLAEKIPGVRMSGRGFTLYLDAARADLADFMYAKAIRQGRDANDQHLLGSIGDVVNSASGRGDLGTGLVGKSQEGLNLLLFSPRLIKSRIDFINPFWYARLDPLARHQAYRAMSGLVVLLASTLGIARAAGAKVNTDPRSSDFAKIKLGNTRLDLAGGFQQYIRILSELATQQTVSSSTGEVKNMGPEAPGKTSDWDVVFRFLRSKLAPLTSAVVDVSQQRNSIGQPLTWGNSVASRLTPLSGQDALSVGQDASSHGLPAGIAAGIGAFGLSAFGGGVQNYTPKQPKQTGGGSSSFWGGGNSSNASFWGK